jgi:pilus assembly protein CpaF
MAIFRRTPVTDGSAPSPPAGDVVPMTTARRAESQFAELKTRIHRQLIDRLDLSKLAVIPPDVVRAEIARVVQGLLDEEQTPLSRQERDNLVLEVWHETFGLGPLEPLMQDPSVSDILVNGPRNIYVERRGKLERTPTVFHDSAHLMQIIERIVSRVGRRIDESSPMVDARLPDGSRVNAIIPPLALDGPMVSIRRFAVDPFKMPDLIRLGALTPALAEILIAAVKVRLNVLVAGGTGAGKTTLLNVLSNAIPNDERIVTIEDSAELQLQQEHVARLETRPANIEGRGEVTQRDLVKNALRMRPDRIIVGEVRAGEAFDMLQAMNTGHDGSMTTVHANTARDALSRVEQMIGMSGIDMPPSSARAQIASAINVVIQIGRQADGRRRLLSLSEVTGMEGPTITMQEIFRFKMTGRSESGDVLGHFEATGIRPKFLQSASEHGVELSAELFRPSLKIGQT